MKARRDEEEDKGKCLARGRSGRRRRKKPSQEAEGGGDTAAAASGDQGCVKAILLQRKYLQQRLYSQTENVEESSQGSRLAEPTSSHRRSIDCCPA